MVDARRTKHSAPTARSVLGPFSSGCLIRSVDSSAPASDGTGLGADEDVGSDEGGSVGVPVGAPVGEPLGASDGVAVGAAEG